MLLDNSVSNEKIANEIDQRKRQKIIPEQDAELNQNRIIDIDHFLRALKKISGHSKVFSCTFENLILRRELKLGLNSKFEFVCNMCHAEFVVETCPKRETVSINYLGKSYLMDKFLLLYIFYIKFPQNW